MTATRLALDLAVTLRHDGHGGVADDLADTAGLATWVRDRATLLDCCAHPGAVDQELLDTVRELRAAVRSLFARAVLPGPPSRADDRRLLPEGEAIGRLNAAAAGVATVPEFSWAPGGSPAVRIRPTGDPSAADRLTAALARAAIAFLQGPERDLLRACPAPRCVRYFVKEHARQEWCAPSCGNRARVARHHERRRAGQGGAP
ncbi:CGNR zinc finger domain-containing protein [Streptomyces sp. NPDC017993]|uniref:CGNR zinc finger domain-containing protein n=1 Tax=Streptomyces sp. NPDC017993 TaxID=3365027 RepID=UPI0037AEE0A0